jgi:hypothetical protein
VFRKSVSWRGRAVESRSDAMMPLVHVSVGVAVALDAAAWASWSFIVGSSVPG